MTKRPILHNVINVKGENNNALISNKNIQVSCNLPESMGIISGEAELIARYLGEILPKIANDNQLE